MNEHKRLPRVVIIAGDGPSSRALIRKVDSFADLVGVFFEPRPSSAKLVRNRIRRLGYLHVTDQLIFQVGISPILQRFARARIQDLQNENGLNTDPLDSDSRIRSVSDITDPVIVERIVALDPDLILINGTRILPKEFLEKFRVPIMNIHAGITPAYRGVHGGYWALQQQNAQECGVTLHRVDAGIDTGAVIAQVRIRPTENDNFATYPWLQLASGVALFEKVLRDFATSGTLPCLSVRSDKSQLFYHPRASQYLKDWWMLGVK